MDIGEGAASGDALVAAEGEEASSSSTAAAATVPAVSALALQAYVCVAVGSGWSNGALHPAGLALALYGFGLALWAAVRLRRGGGARRSLTSLYAVVAVLPAVSILQSPAPLYTEGWHWYDLTSRGFALAALALLGVHAGGDERWRRRALVALLGGGFAMLLLAPIGQPHPVIDGWQLFQHGARNLLHGRNPYTTPVPDIYEGAFDYGYRIDVFDYLPLNLLVALPGVVLLGDYRFELALAMIAATLLLRATGRRLGLPARLVDLLSVAVVLHPRGPYVVACGWAEPFLILGLALFVYFQVRAPGGTAQAIAFLALPSLKQYLAVPSLLYLGLRPRWRSLAVGVAIAVAPVLAFLAWDFHATLEYGVLFVVRRVPFRPDSLSIPSLLYHFTHQPCSKLPAMLAQVLVGGAAFVWLRGRALGGFLLASALALLAAFLVGSQAFLNYYLLVAALLVFAALVLAVSPTAGAAVVATGDGDGGASGGMR
jgi:hypothetical protein